MVIDPRRKRFVMSMQLYAALFCQSQAYPTENKPEKARSSGFFYFQKKTKVLKKSQNFNIWFQKKKLATLLHKN